VFRSSFPCGAILRKMVKATWLPDASRWFSKSGRAASPLFGRAVWNRDEESRATSACGNQTA
jgi:hypothetical protein